MTLSYRMDLSFTLFRGRTSHSRSLVLNRHNDHPLHCALCKHLVVVTRVMTSGDISKRDPLLHILFISTPKTYPIPYTRTYTMSLLKVPQGGILLSFIFFQVRNPDYQTKKGGETRKKVRRGFKGRYFLSLSLCVREITLVDSRQGLSPFLYNRVPSILFF